jgi:hypothetical protein
MVINASHIRAAALIDANDFFELIVILLVIIAYG